MADAYQALDEVLAETDRLLGAGRSAAPRVTPLGFSPLDASLGGGLRAGELALLGGPQGLGKTTMALQMLRNVAAAGGVAVYLSYEHDAATILERLVSLEAGAADGLDAVPLRRIREAMENVRGDRGTLVERLASTPGGSEAVRAVATYAPRFVVHRSNGSTTDVAEIRSVVERATAPGCGPVLVVVDYLQKVPVLDRPGDEDERVTVVAQGLKDLALEASVPILAVVAADKEGITSGRRMRVHHLRGASALAYEADVVLVMNDKYDVVARHHLVFDVGNAERFRQFVVLSVEKNRTGLDRLDLEYRKRFENGRFEPQGAAVTEQLVDERVFVE